MGTYTKVKSINDSLNNIKTSLTNKGSTPSGDITTYATAVSNLPTPMPVIKREVSAQGVFRIPTEPFTLSLPNTVTTLGTQALNGYKNCTGLTSVNLSNITTINGDQAMNGAFSECTNLISVNLSNLTTINGSNAFSNAFQNCTGLTSIDLSSLTTVSGGNALSQAFQNCTGLTSVDLSSLTTISGSMKYAFQGCTSLTVLSFPSLTSTGVGQNGYYTNMLSSVTGCTVHFPSNLQSVIGSWSSVTSGFGGTNTTVLFDLPVTT